MTKPREFSELQIVRHETPYEVNEQFSKGPHAGIGTLGTGRVVWTEQAAAENNEVVHAFAEGIGVVAVQAESLRP